MSDEECSWVITGQLPRVPGFPAEEMVLPLSLEAAHSLIRPDSSAGPARDPYPYVSLQILPTTEFAPLEFSPALPQDQTTRLDPLPRTLASSPSVAATPSKTCCCESPKRRCPLR